MIYFIVALFSFIGGFLVGRNNPNLSAVNKAIAAGKVVVAAGNKLVAKL